MRRPPPTFTAAVVTFAATLAVATTARAQQGVDPPPPPSVQISDVKVVEGNAGMTTFQASVTLVFAATPMSVEITAVPGTATTADYVFAPADLTLAPNVPQTVSGFIIGDTAFEGDETFTLKAQPTSPGWFGFSGGGLVTIVDDDGDAASRLSVVAESVPEGNQGWHPVDVTVRLAPASTSPVTVAYATAQGTTNQQPGIGAFDYHDVSGTLTFAPGETTKTITVDVNGDTLWERDVAFVVTLSNPMGALLGTASANITLVNDDAASVVTIDDLQVTEGDVGMKAALLTLHFAPAVPMNTKVHLNVVGGSARDGEDFVGGFQTIYPPSGATTMTFPVEVIGDTTPECDEGVLIQYAGVYTGDDTQKVAHLLIVDDDGAPKDAGTCPDPFGAVADPGQGDGGASTGSPDAVAADGAATTPKGGDDGGATAGAGAAGATTPATTGAAGTTTPATTGAAGATGAASDHLVARNGCAVADGGASSWGAALVLLALALPSRRRRDVG